MWTGKQGIENGLVDKLGDFYTAINVAKKMAGIPVEDYVRLVVYPKQKTLLEKLFSGSLMASVNNPIEHLDYFDKLPLIFKNIVVALPYFRSAQPLYLCTFYLEIN